MRSRFTICVLLLASVLLMFAPQRSAAQFDQKNGAWRHWLAQETLQSLLPIYNALPTLSPSEEMWVQKELQAAAKSAVEGSLDRLNNLTQTREYSIQEAHKYLDRAHSALVQISGKHFIGKKQEVLLWAIVALSLSECELYHCLDNLSHKGVLDQKLTLPDKVSSLRTTPTLALTYIIVPFLADKLPD